MKKFLSLFIALALLLFSACADVMIPASPPSQEELEAAFASNLLRFCQNTDLLNGALGLDVSEGDHSLLSAVLQESADVVDLNATLNGAPTRVQLTADALLFTSEGQLYKLPYDTLIAALESMSAQTNSMTGDLYGLLSRLGSTFRETVIMPSMSFVTVDGTQHVRIDVTADRIVEFGDRIVGDPQYRPLLIALLGTDDVTAYWLQIRELLKNGSLPVSVTADVTLGESVISGTAEGVLADMRANMTFGFGEGGFDIDLNVNGTTSISGHSDPSTGAYEWHMKRADDSCDVTYTPTPDGWRMQASSAQGGIALDIDATSVGAVYDAAFNWGQSGYGIPGLTADGSFHLDRSNGGLKGAVALSNGMNFDLNGGADDGTYHATLTAKLGTSTLATADFTCADTPTLTMADLSVSDNTGSVMNAGLTFAKETGAYSLRGDFDGGSWLEASGVLTGTEQSCVLTSGPLEDVIETRLCFSLVNDAMGCSLSLSADQVESFDAAMVRVFNLSATLDRRTGNFAAHCAIPADMTYIDVEGTARDGLFRLRYNNTWRHNMGYLDVSFKRDDDGFAGNLSANFPGLTLDGDVLWSPCMKSLNFSASSTRLSLLVMQDFYGLPTELQLTLFNMRPFVNIDLVANRDQIVMRQGSLVTTIRGSFTDENTYFAEITQQKGRQGVHYRAALTFTARPDELSIRFTDSDARTYSTVLSRPERTPIEPLDARDDAVTITPEMLSDILQTAQGVYSGS